VKFEDEPSSVTFKFIKYDENSQHLLALREKKFNTEYPPGNVSPFTHSLPGGLKYSSWTGMHSANVAL